MTVQITFYIDVEPERTEQIIAILKGFEFAKVQLASELGTSSQTQRGHEIICSMSVSDLEVSRPLHIWHAIDSIEGVRTVIPIYSTKRTKKDLIPMFISSGIVFVIILAAIFNMKKEATLEDILLIAGIPTIVTFFSQVLYRYFK